MSPARKKYFALNAANEPPHMKNLTGHKYTLYGFTLGVPLCRKLMESYLKGHLQEFLISYA